MPIRMQGYPPHMAIGKWTDGVTVEVSPSALHLVFFFDFFAGFLVDNFHRQLHFAAIIDADQFDLNHLALDRKSVV